MNEFRCAFLRVHQVLSGRHWATVAAAWVIVVLLSKLTAPLNLAFGERANYLNSSSVVALMLPIAVTSQMLHEGPKNMVLSAGRNLGPYRAIVGFVYVAISSLLAAVLAVVLGFSSLQFASVSLLFSSVTLFGVTCLGCRYGWVAGAAVAILASVPGLVPLDYNVVYLTSAATVVLWSGIGMTALGVVMYSQIGAGPEATKSLDDLY